MDSQIRRGIPDKTGGSRDLMRQIIENRMQDLDQPSEASSIGGKRPRDEADVTSATSSKRPRSDTGSGSVISVEDTLKNVHIHIDEGIIEAMGLKYEENGKRFTKDSREELNTYLDTLTKDIDQDLNNVNGIKDLKNLEEKIRNFESKAYVSLRDSQNWNKWHSIQQHTMDQALKTLYGTLNEVNDNIQSLEEKVTESSSTVADTFKTMLNEEQARQKDLEDTIKDKTLENKSYEVDPKIQRHKAGLNITLQMHKNALSTIKRQLLLRGLQSIEQTTLSDLGQRLPTLLKDQQQTPQGQQRIKTIHKAFSTLIQYHQHKTEEHENSTIISMAGITSFLKFKGDDTGLLERIEGQLGMSHEEFNTLRQSVIPQTQASEAPSSIPRLDEGKQHATEELSQEEISGNQAIQKLAIAETRLDSQGKEFHLQTKDLELQNSIDKLKNIDNNHLKILKGAFKQLKEIYPDQKILCDSLIHHCDTLLDYKDNNVDKRDAAIAASALLSQLSTTDKLEIQRFSATILKQIQPLTLEQLRTYVETQKEQLLPQRTFTEISPRIEIPTSTDFGREGLDMSRIGPPANILAKYRRREEQYLRKLLVDIPSLCNTYLNGKSDEEAIKEAIEKMKNDLDTHARSLVKDAIDKGATVFRCVELEHLSTILSDKDKPFPSWMKPEDEQRLRKDYAMYGELQHPMHAYLSPNDRPLSNSQIDVFGKAAVRIRMDDIYKRSKIAFDDTYLHYWRNNDEISIFPQPLDKPGRGVFPMAEMPDGNKDEKIEQGIERWRNTEYNPFSIENLGSIAPYAEVQIFGGITRSHIDKVFFPTSINLEEIETIGTLLESCGLEYEFYGPMPTDGLAVRDLREHDLLPGFSLSSEEDWFKSTTGTLGL